MTIFHKGKMPKKEITKSVSMSMTAVAQTCMCSIGILFHMHHDACNRLHDTSTPNHEIFCFWHHVAAGRSLQQLSKNMPNVVWHWDLSLAIYAYAVKYISQPPRSESSLTLYHHCHQDCHHHVSWNHFVWVAEKLAKKQE